MTSETNNADYFIKTLGLIPHPEGGYFRETYRSSDSIDTSILSDSFTENHVLSTSILFLLKSGECSKFHKLNRDEMWHFHYGCPIKVVSISENGFLKENILSPEIDKNHVFQVLLPANTWFAAYPIQAASFSLVGCTVAPGFEFSDLELANAKYLLEKFPQHKELIKTLT